MDRFPTELPAVLNSGSPAERLLSQFLPNNCDRLKHVEITIGEFSYKADYYESPAVVEQ